MSIILSTRVDIMLTARGERPTIQKNNKIDRWYSTFLCP